MGKARRAGTNGELIGYARVSTSDQDLSVQREALIRAGVHPERVFEEKKSGTRRDGRKELRRALALLREGDTLVVTRLDRLGRSLKDLADIAEEIEAHGANLRVIEQSVDTSTSAGRAFFGMLATFAQFETDVRRERQMEGIARARERGVYKGRRRSVDRDAVRTRLEAGDSPTVIARELGIARKTVYRISDELGMAIQANVRRARAC